jgi:hypothetical protein
MPKAKFSISMDEELVERIDRIAQARDEGRATVIERMARNGIADEERFLGLMDDPVAGALLSRLLESPRLMRGIAAMVAEDLGEDEAAAIREKALTIRKGSKGRRSAR